MPGIIIRPYQPKDHDRVWALHREGVMDTRSDYPEMDHSAYEEDLRNIERDYLSLGSNFWVVQADRRLVGMAAIQRIDSLTGRLRRMRVTGAWRRKGLATDLLATAEEFCHEVGYKRIILDTTQTQTAAHALYEKHGFVRTGERIIGEAPVYDYEKILS
jgi:GNAT superfamily N-acetyltransferase